mgnify:CR=1 FL=1
MNNLTSALLNGERDSWAVLRDEWASVIDESSTAITASN